MSLTSTLQQNHQREKRLQFIRAHQAAFDVEPRFPLPLFEDFVLNTVGNCKLEASCKIELERLIASRFVLFFDNLDDAIQSPHKLGQVLNFLDRVESRVGININRDLLEQFIKVPEFLSMAAPTSCGVDLRMTLPDSSIKTHVRLDYYEQPSTSTVKLIDFALSQSALDHFSLEFIRTFSRFIPKHKLIPQIGFDFYFNGSTEIELYLEIREEYFKRPQVWQVLQQRFSRKLLSPLEKSSRFGIGLSNANASPVLYYLLKNKHDFSNYFLVESTAERVNSFYRQQESEITMWFAASEQELEKTKIENIRLYYYHHDSI